jgi:divalent metal cation (Fe/Co/Zn/Cd) transporter
MIGVTEPPKESMATVAVAGAANLTIAIAKLVAGLVSGSSR